MVAHDLVKEKEAARKLDAAIAHLFRCYAGYLHLMRGHGDTRPEKTTNKGYAPKFERLTLFPRSCPLA